MFAKIARKLQFFAIFAGHFPADRNREFPLKLQGIAGAITGKRVCEASELAGLIWISPLVQRLTMTGGCDTTKERCNGPHFQP